jgi:hypothetical protein
VRRAIYRGPPRGDDERTFFDSLQRILHVRKDEVEQREAEWRKQRQAGKVKEEVTGEADQAPPAR